MIKKAFFIILLGSILYTYTYAQQSASNEIQNQKKLALVIGNGNYLSGSYLSNPENDARAIKLALQNVGFTVMEYENLDQIQMKKAIDAFGANLKGNDVGLFFYAGHGIQSKGYNYLIPIDAKIQSEQQVEYDCVQADRVLALMEASGTKVNVIILDACRNNPFERSWTRSANGSGLAYMNAPSGTLIAYSTAPGKTASDGSGENSPYTSAILESINIPNITIIEMFQIVRNIVSQKSNKQQTPWESTSLTGNLYFNKILTTADSSNTKSCITLIKNQEFNQGTYSIFPITKNLSPKFPISISISFSVESISKANMLWRYGTNEIISQAYVLNGTLNADFRNGGNIVGGRMLTSHISGGKHNVTLRYNGSLCELIIDGNVVDSIQGTISVGELDGNIWVGRNGFATDPAYLSGKVSFFQVCFE